MKKIVDKDIRIRYIDVLDSPKKKRYFRLMRKWFLEAFPEDTSYIKIMRKILKRKLFFYNEIFRLLLMLKNDKVIGGCVYRYWFDYKVAVLEYIFVAPNYRSQGIGTLLYKKMRKDLKRMKCEGLFFSMKGTKDLEKCIRANGEEVYPEPERISRNKRERFYKRLGVGKLKINYLTPPYFKFDMPFCNPYLMFDPLEKRKRVRVSSHLIKKVIKRVFRDYYDADLKSYKVRKLLKSINMQKISWER